MVPPVRRKCLFFLTKFSFQHERTQPEPALTVKGQISDYDNPKSKPKVNASSGNSVLQLFSIAKRRLP